MICPSCGKTALPSQSFCADCGSPLVDMSYVAAPTMEKYCRQCHTPGDYDRVYCSHCGSLLMHHDAAGVELLRLRELGMYVSAGSAIAQCMGTLIIRDDQIIFEISKTTAVRKLLDKNTPVAQYEDGHWLMEDIRSVEKGRQCGIKAALVLKLKDGSSLRFSGSSLNADMLRQAVQYIEISIN